jgi:hypothetical protein
MTTGNVGQDQPGNGPQRCAQCGSTFFEEGFVEDGGRGAPGFARWLPGPLTFGWFGRPKLPGRRHRILAYRCTSCHHLALYVGRE